MSKPTKAQIQAMLTSCKAELESFDPTASAGLLRLRASLAARVQTNTAPTDVARLYDQAKACDINVAKKEALIDKAISDWLLAIAERNCRHQYYTISNEALTATQARQAQEAAEKLEIVSAAAVQKHQERAERTYASGSTAALLQMPVSAGTPTELPALAAPGRAPPAAQHAPLLLGTAPPPPLYNLRRKSGDPQDGSKKKPKKEHFQQLESQSPTVESPAVDSPSAAVGGDSQESDAVSPMSMASTEGTNAFRRQMFDQE
jgi:hypothetical protein